MSLVCRKINFNKMVKIVHLHGFKCAGTTFIWILEKIYGSKLLYVEKRGGKERLFWKDLQEACNLLNYNAITSHTLEFPRIQANDYLFVEFVREPLSRIKSAYNFQIKVGDIKPNLLFNEYVKQSIGTTRDNFMSRRLSTQSNSQSIWSLDKNIIELNQANLFVGLVEKFDESLVLLEELLLKSYDLKLDLSYPKAQNKSIKNDLVGNKYSISEDVLNKVTQKDFLLYDRVRKDIDAKISLTVNFNKKHAEFKERCLNLKRQNLKVSVKSPNKWRML